MTTAKFGNDEFLRRCGGISRTLRNRLEREGVIKPQRVGTWRSFTARDVTAARAWIAQHGRQRGRRIEK